MRMLIFVLFTVLGVAQAASDYVETRKLELDAAELEEFVIEAGAGTLTVEGVRGATEITVDAQIVVPDEDDSDAKKLVESRLRLTLERKAGRATLISEFDSRGWRWRDSPRIDLKIEIPPELALTVDDGSGSLSIRNVSGNISLDDGSGSLVLDTVGGSVRIDDGSGSITLVNAGGDVQILDGSGSIAVEDVRGTVTVDDGSGSINVRRVDEDLIILDDGSGSLNFSDIGGRVEQDG